MIKSKKIKYLLSSFIFFNIINSSVDSFAKVTIEKYTMKDATFTTPTESPPAYRISGSEYFPDGTILYRQTYKDVVYYSPKPPKHSQEAKGESKKYVDWGFWEFKANQKPIVLGGDVVDTSSTKITDYYRSNHYYSVGQVNKDAIAYGSTVSGVAQSTGKTLKKGTLLKVLTITTESSGTEYVYFRNTHGVPSYNDVARIESKYVDNYSKDEIKIYFDEILTKGSSCRPYYINFLKYQTTNMGYAGSGHSALLESSLNEESVKVPSDSKISDLKKCGLAGKVGEWQYLGLSSKGNLVVNPYFPTTWSSFLGNGSIAKYDWRDITELDSTSYTYPTTFDKNYKKEKKDILQKIIDEGHGPVTSSGHKLTKEEFAGKVSLLTHPVEETPVFIGQRTYNNVIRDFVVPGITRELYLAKVSVVDDDNKTILSGKRTSKNGKFTFTENSNTLARGQHYTVKVQLGNGSKSSLRASKLGANAGVSYSSGSFSYKDVNLKDINQLGGTNVLSNKGGLGDVNGKPCPENTLSNVFNFDLYVPVDYQYDYMDIYGFVAPEHTGTDNLDFTNDSGGIRVPVSKAVGNGDISVSTIELLAKNDDGVYDKVVYKKTGNKVEVDEAPIPGNKYKIRYTATYKGADIDNWVYDYPNGDKTKVKQWINKGTKTYKVPFNYSITRKVGSSLADDRGDYNNSYFVTSSGSTNIPMKNGTKMYFTTKAVMLEHPYLYTYFKINITDNNVNSVINTNTDNSSDRMSAVINKPYNISISEVRIVPIKEYTGTDDTKTSYSVVYNATLSVPDYAKSSYIAKVKTSILIEGSKKNNAITVTDVLKPGTNKNLTHVVSDVPVSKNDTSVTAEIILNSDRASYENGGYDDNVGRNSSSVEKIKNPSNGKPSDKASNTTANNVSSSTKGGDANNNCLVPRTKISYVSKYGVRKWGSSALSYTSLAGNKTINFNKYNISSEQTVTKNNEENFIIKDILFRSKTTKDKNLGTDGWVSMLNTNDSEIKAGYGFELKVIVQYKTNALLNNPTEVDNSNKGTMVTDISTDINIVPDLFIELPGTTGINGTRIILSSTGYTGTKKGLNVKQTKNKVTEGSGSNKMQVSEWEYTLKPSTTNGVSEVGKVYIPNNLKNGAYKVSIYTPPVSGVSSLAENSTFKYSSLCDRKDVNVNVKGSATDDLNSHVTQ